VLVVDSADRTVIFAKNAQAIQPIASITKLMTALVVLDGRFDLDTRIEITEADKSTVKFSRSRLLIGTVATRRELLRVALMASDNRAAAALARTYPGGTEAALAEMNRKAKVLDLVDTRFDDPTGLSAGNVSTAVDLAKLIVVARRYPEIREFSTAANASIRTPRGEVVFGNTNGLTRTNGWDIDLSKTGFIAEAGRCLVLHTRIGSRWMSMVLLDAAGRYTAIADAQRLRQWLEPKPEPKAAPKAPPARAAAKG
jgi:serine-type D-Ala-D-Ala endopeptidase (penicillin-binding protein 7)